MTQHGDYLRRLRDRFHEDMVLLDEMILEQDRIDDKTLNDRLDALAAGRWTCRICGAVLPSGSAFHQHVESVHVTRSDVDLRDDEEQARAELHILRGDIA